MEPHSPSAPSLALEAPAPAGRGRGIPWGVAALVAGAIALLVALAPTGVLVAPPALAIAAILVWRHGRLYGTWYLFLFLVPLRMVTGLDVWGTVTLFPGDVLLYLLTAVLLWRHGMGDLWRKSTVFRLGLLLILMSGLGLYTATRLHFGIASMQRIVGQVAVFAVARHLVRNGERATHSLLAFLAGITLAAAYGLYQAAIPVEAWNVANWDDMILAVDSSGVAHVRVESTFNHTLRFSHALSAAFGIALGLVPLRRGLLWRGGLLGLAVATAWCNRYTYSISGTLGVAAAIGVFALVHRRHRFAILLPIAVLAALVTVPQALLQRVQDMSTGRSTSAMARIITYRQALQVVRDHPLLGVGWGGIHTSLEYDYRISRAETVGFTAENQFLLRGVALGIPGILLMMALCVVFFRNATRRPRDTRAGPGAPGPETDGASWPAAAILVGGAAYYVQAMFIPAAEMSNSYLLWFLYALAEARSGPPLESGR